MPYDAATQALPALDALVVLGCKVGPDGELSGPSLRRVERAAKAYSDGQAQLLVVSGGRRWGRKAEAEAMRDGLMALGVPRAHIAVELASLSTQENARFTAPQLAQRGVKRIGLVSCEWHLPRAQKLFEHHGLSVTLVPTPAPSRGPMQTIYRRVRERVASWLDRVH